MAYGERLPESQKVLAAGRLENPRNQLWFPVSQALLVP